MATKPLNPPLIVSQKPSSTVNAVKPVATVSSWRLEWQKRGARAGEDWMVKTGLMVAGDDGVVVPMHAYLRSVITILVNQLSQISVENGGRHNVRALNALAHGTINNASNVVGNPVEMPDSFAARSASTMLWGNFCDAVVAVFDMATNTDVTLNQTLCIDSTTLSVVAPRNYSRIRAKIEGAEPMKDFFMAKGPSKLDGAWDNLCEDGDFSPTFLGRLMNALNCRFPGDPCVAKAKMKDYIRQVGRKFARILSEFDSSLSEAIALAKYRTT